MAPPKANKRRQNLTVKEVNLKKRKTRQPASEEKMVMETRAVASLEKNMEFDGINDTNFCLGLRHLDLQNDVDVHSRQRYLSCPHKSVNNKYLDVYEKSDIPAQTRIFEKNTTIDTVFPGSIMNHMSVTHNTEYYCCLVEDFMVIRAKTPVVLLIPTQHDCEQWKALIECCNSLLVSINQKKSDVQMIYYK